MKTIIIPILITSLTNANYYIYKKGIRKEVTQKEYINHLNERHNKTINNFRELNNKLKKELKECREINKAIHSVKSNDINKTKKVNKLVNGYIYEKTYKNGLLIEDKIYPALRYNKNGELKDKELHKAVKEVN